jgi:hypothetical protein
VEPDLGCTTVKLNARNAFGVEVESVALTAQEPDQNDIPSSVHVGRRLDPAEFRMQRKEIGVGWLLRVRVDRADFDVDSLTLSIRQPVEQVIERPIAHADEQRIADFDVT